MIGRFNFLSFEKSLLLLLLLAPLCAASDSWRYEETHNDTRDFVAGGMLHVRLSVGDMRIERTDSNQIRLRYTIKSRRETNLKDTHVDFAVHGNDASIEFHAPSSSNTEIDVELDVPQNTNLDVHEKVGDLAVKDVEGDKDLDLGVGDIRVDDGHPSYRLIRANTRIGDVNGEGYGETSGWLGKTLKYDGPGKYGLRAQVVVGDITVEGK
jgi:hypothetical protein